MMITIPGQWPAGVAVAARWLVTIIQHPAVGPIQLRTAHDVSNDDLREIWAKKQGTKIGKIMEHLEKNYVSFSMKYNNDNYYYYYYYHYYHFILIIIIIIILLLSLLLSLLLFLLSLLLLLFFYYYYYVYVYIYIYIYGR